MSSQNARKPLRPERATETPASVTPPAPPALFLRTKLLPPRPAPALLPRPRLTDRLQTNLVNPVTLVTANAGSGKTTLVAEFVRAHVERLVWYQLDRTDADPFVFLGYIAHGIKQAFPGFGETTLSYLQQSSGELAQYPERAADVLLTEILDTVDQRFVLVLDDYHHLGAETPAHAVVDRLLAYLPDVMHVIIISRDVPPLALARLRAHSALAIIGRDELLFTDEETQELFRKVFNLELTPEQLSEYRERTRGWITALQLIRQVAQRRALAGGAGAAAPDLSEVLRQSEHDIFDYFAEEVFADEPEEAQGLLLRMSLLDRVEAETCGGLFPTANCGALLPALVRRNVFLAVASDGRGEEYRLHPLFQDFLRRRLRAERGQAGVAAEHARFADYFLARGQWKEALRHLLAAKEHERAAELIAAQGGEWIAAGALSSLVTFADALPHGALEAYPRAIMHRAEVARLQGEYDAAQSLFRRAVMLLRAAGDAEGEAEALHSLATIARRAGDYETAFAHLDRATGLTDERAPVRMKCGNTRGLCLFAQGRWDEAESEFRAALELAEELGDEQYIRFISHNLGLPLMVRGDFGEALRWMRRMARDKEQAPPIPQEATAHLNMSRFYLLRGDMQACESHLERALEICQLFNLIALRGEIFEAYGNFYREANDVAHAAEYYERAARAYAEASIEPARRELWEEQALLALRTGDVAGARATIDRLVVARSAAGDEMLLRAAELTRARIRLAQGEYEAARAELEPAQQFFRASGLYYHEAQAALALALCEQATGREVEMLRRARRMLDLAARYDYEYWLAREVTRHPQLFSHPELAELLPPELREQLAQPAATVAATPQVGAPMPGAPGQLAPVAPALAVDLTVNMLGPVEIFRDPTRPFRPDAWTTKRARDILCFIVSRPHRRAAKDTIIDTFWGESDFEAVEKNFHPTISHIRKALNSNQPLKQNFLLYRDGDYQLNPEFSYRIDIEEFDRLVTAGEAARRAGETERCEQHYMEAVALYRGDFMQGSYDEWAEEQRAYYREQHLRLLEALVTLAQKSDEWARSLDLAQRILRDDPFREDAHRMIMRAHARMGNRGAVKEQYETLRRLLKKELGVEPAAETQKAFRESLG